MTKDYRPSAESVAYAAAHAKSLLDDVDLLMANHRYRRALALAITADEEIAKAWILEAAHALGASLFPDLASIVRRHDRKHDLAWLSAGVHRFIPLFREMIVVLRNSKQQMDHESFLRGEVERLFDRHKIADLADGKESLVLGGHDPQAVRNHCLYADKEKDEASAIRVLVDDPSIVRRYVNEVSHRMKSAGVLLEPIHHGPPTPLDSDTQEALEQAWNNFRSGQLSKDRRLTNA